jgi:ParB-like chromosome segregation protein Spo0J
MRMEAFYPDCWVLMPPHKVTKPEQVLALAEDMKQNGWQGAPLIGYPFYNRIQLLSGTHRHAAAQLAGIYIPVLIRDYEDVCAAYGNIELWQQLMRIYEV